MTAEFLLSLLCHVQSVWMRGVDVRACVKGLFSLLSTVFLPFPVSSKKKKVVIKTIQNVLIAILSSFFFTLQYENISIAYNYKWVKFQFPNFQQI